MWQLWFIALLGGAVVHAAHTAGNWVTNRALRLPQHAKVDPNLRALVNGAGEIVGHVVVTQAETQLSKLTPSSSPIFPGLMLLLALASMAVGSMVKADTVPFDTGSMPCATGQMRTATLNASEELMPSTATTGNDWEGWAAIGGVGAAVALVESLGGEGHPRASTPTAEPVPEQPAFEGLLWLVGALGLTYKGCDWWRKRAPQERAS